MKRLLNIYEPLPKFLAYLCVFLFSFFASSPIFSQVGINTTTPDPSAVLDVSASDKGILIPRVSLTNITQSVLDGTNTAATGLLIYNTNASVVGGSGVGYYSYNGSSWEKLITSATSDDHDFYGEGTTNPPSSINDDIYTQGNVAIGQNTADYPLDIASTAQRAINISLNGSSSTDYAVYSQLSGTGNGFQYGALNFITNTGTGVHHGVYNSLSGNGNGIQYGVFNNMPNSGTGDKFGTYNRLGSNANANLYGTYNQITAGLAGNKYGTYINIFPAVGGTHYGLYSEVLRSGSFAGYFLGSVSIGTTTSTNYILPADRGTANQVMQTDGSGNLSWVDGASLGTDDADFFEEGTTSPPTSINADIYTQGNVAIGKNTADYTLDIETTGAIGQRTELTGGLGTTLYGHFTNVTNTGNGIHYGNQIILGGTGTGVQYGTSNIINNSGNASHFGTFNNLAGGGTGTQYGFYSNINNAGSGDHYGVSNNMASSTSGTKYGVRNNIFGSGNMYGTHNIQNVSGTGVTIYGTFNDVVSTIAANGTYYGTYNRFNNLSSGFRYGMYNDLNGHSGGLSTGVHNEITSSSGGALTGVTNNISAGAGSVYGVNNSISGNSNTTTYGTRNSISGTSSFTAYGSYNFIDPLYVGPQYAMYAEALRSTGTTFAGYFLGNVGIGTTTSNTYTLPASRGTADQIMQTDGSGNVSWVNATALNDHDFYAEGTTLPPTNISDDIYTQGNVAIGKNTADYNLDIVENTNNITVNLSNSATSGIISGISNIVSGNATNTQRGVYNLLAGTGNNVHIGTYNNLNGSGSGNKYGSFNSILNTAGGTHYAVYGSALKSGSFAGFFLGNVYVGTDLVNGYTFPGIDGTANQMMQTDGSGVVSWIDPPASYWSRTGTNLDVATANDDIQFSSDQTTIRFPSPGATPSAMIQMFTGGSSNTNRMVIAHSPSFPAWGLEYRDSGDSFVFKSSVADIVEIDLNGGFPLRVYGRARAVDFQSDTTTYPDYVFEKYFEGYSEINPTYNFRSLAEIEEFISKKGHLPGVKSFEEVEAAGMTLNLTETTVKNLEKIEELFLYAIELKKENEALKKNQKTLEERLQKIEKMLTEK